MLIISICNSFIGFLLLGIFVAFITEYLIGKQK
jgi:hypothetical protein